LNKVNYIRFTFNIIFLSALYYYVPNNFHGWIIIIPSIFGALVFLEKTKFSLLLILFFTGSTIYADIIKNETFEEILLIILIFTILNFLSISIIFFIKKNIKALQKEFKNRLGAERELRFLAYFDPLTNLPNRKSLEQYSQKKLSKIKNMRKNLPYYILIWKILRILMTSLVIIL